MSQKIQVRRGTNAARQSVTFDNGEPIWTTDTKKLFVGDGVTAGGINASASLNGNNSVLVELSTTATGNGANLMTALNTAKALSPSITNPVTVLIPPGVYETRDIIFIYSGYISLVGLGNKEHTIIRGGNQSGSFSSLLITAAQDVKLRNLTLMGIDSGSFVISSLYLSPASKAKIFLDSVIVDHSGTNSNATKLSNTSINIGYQGTIEANDCKFLGEWSPHPYVDGTSLYLVDSIFTNCFFSGQCNPYFPADNTLFKDCIFASLTGFSVRENNAEGSNSVNRYHNCSYIRPDGFYFKHDMPSWIDPFLYFGSIFNNCYIDGNGSTGIMTNPQIINSTIINRSSTASALQYLSPVYPPNILNSIILNTNPRIPAITGNNISGCVANCILNSNISGISNLISTPNNTTYTGITIQSLVV